jgi:DNA-binding Lrp family transcriptional regulator
LSEGLKSTEIRIIAELMKNSHRSDREIAHAIGVSQPTVSRTIKRLEKEGIIKEYTMIPDFRRLGYQIMALAFLGKPETQKQEESEELRRAARELEKKTPYANIMVVDGMGIGKGRVLINLYKDYRGYMEGMTTIKSLPHVEPDEAESFLVDLCDERNFRVLSLGQVARHIQSFAEDLTRKPSKETR